MELLLFSCVLTLRFRGLHILLKLPPAHLQAEQYTGQRAIVCQVDRHGGCWGYLRFFQIPTVLQSYRLLFEHSFSDAQNITLLASFKAYNLEL